MGTPGRVIYLTGPSGSGKDSLIEAARAALHQRGYTVARRIITRSAESVGEDAVGVSAEAFEQLEAEGAFAMSWRANGLAYAIPAVIDEWLAQGQHVVVNGSRAYLDEARRRYPTLLPILLTVGPQVLRERLLRRGREVIEQIEARLARNLEFENQINEGVEQGAMPLNVARVQRLDNSGTLSETVERLLVLLSDAEPGRT